MEIVFPGALFRMPRLNIPRGVKPWFAKEAPWIVTEPLRPLIPSALSTAPAFASQSETYCFTE